MKINVYTEELTTEVRIVRTKYVSNRGEQRQNWGIRFILKSHDNLHYSERDDDRSAVTFWIGQKWDDMKPFLMNAIDEINKGEYKNK